jgi:hypothetical protein
MKRTLIGLAIAGSAFALAAPASAHEICALHYTGQGIVCVDTDRIIGSIGG